MSQRNSRRQPVYSADTLALRYLCGLVLVALGVVMFLAVEMRLTGNVFDVLKQACYGLTGGLAVILPVFPIWAGVLVIWSSQRKAPVKPFVYGCLAFLGICTFVVLVTKIGSEEYLGMLKRTSDGTWTGLIRQGYQQSIQLKASGGALGIILAYPCWNLVGTILGAVILFLLTLLCLLLALNLTPARMKALASGELKLFGRRQNDSRAIQDQQQIAFQQEQERQRQMAYAQQQAYIMQQQAEARQGSGKWSRQTKAPAGQTGPSAPAQGWPAGGQNTGAQQPWPDTPVQDRGVQDWQQQLTDQRAAADTGRRSRIFDRKDSQEPQRSSRIFDTAPVGENANTGRNLGYASEQGTPKASRIFGKRKNQDDGLSDLSEEEKRQEGMAYPGSDKLHGQTGRRPAVRGAEQENAASAGEVPAEKVPASVRRNQQIRMEQQQVEEDLEQWRRPAEEPQREDPRDTEPDLQPYGNPKGTRSSMNELQPEDRLPEQSGQKSGTGVSRTRRTSAAENGGKQPPEAQQKQAETDRPARGRRENRSAEEENRKPEQISIPVGKETIPDPTWKPELKRVEQKEPEPEEEYWEPTPYYAPPITDLKKPEASALDTTLEDEERSRNLERTLESFKVQARVKHVTHGPVISRFELELAPGTKVGKVSELEKDIACGMQATSIRIEAPIPGKNLVGVEVPNPKRTTVTLREVLESPQMQNAESVLTVALGKDIAGTPVICDLARMPHMLIAGATGSGKSVCINTIINSLLYRAGPDEVKLILVDPKVVELQCYNGIPHLLLPVVNDPHKAAAALAWAVAEMMERYDQFSARGVRNLEGYNRILKPGEKPMPRIVIIIDELADLMMVCKKDVEEYICRLTQLARAAGIHLIVATQRPSVDVITGLIKANIPSRIAFKTASYVDSRTILDRNGSEQLLGWGDMLYLPTGSFAPTRIQGCFLSDDEVNRIADHVRQANPCVYDPNVLDKLEQLSKGQEDGPGMDIVGGDPADNGSGDADLFAQAVEFAIADGQISTSTLQRRLKVGYARAGRLTDEMEERGIVSAKDGSKPRKCLITREQWEEMKAGGAAS